MNRDQKAQKVAELRERLSRAGLVVLTDFSGQNVAQMTDLRAKLKKVQGEYQVAKNTLIRLAAKGTPAEKLGGQLVGPNGLALAYGDVAAVAKALNEVLKDRKNKLSLKGGLLGGSVIDVEGLKALADLPGREVLLAQMLGALNGIPTRAVTVLAAVIRQFLGVLKAIEEDKSKAAA